MKTSRTLVLVAALVAWSPREIVRASDEPARESLPSEAQMATRFCLVQSSHATAEVRLFENACANKLRHCFRERHATLDRVLSRCDWASSAIRAPGWSEFATEGATLALHASESLNPERPALKESPPGRCRPGLSVPDLDEFHQKMPGRNVPCLQEPTEMFGARIAQYVDPDGLVISVGEERRST